MSKTTNQPTLWLPAAADAVQATPDATAWAAGAWADLTTSSASVMYPRFLAVLPNDGGVLTELSAQIEIGVDPTGGTTRIVVATCRVRFGANQWGGRATIPLPLIYSVIPSGSRVSVRVTHSASSDTDVYRIALGYQTSLGGATGYLNTVLTCTPIDSATASIAGTTGWANGAWTDLITALAADALIVGVVAAGWTVNGEIELGADPTGGTSYVSIAPSLPYTTPAADSGTGIGYVRLPHPIRVTAGSRIAMRQRANTSSAFNGTIWHQPAAA